MLGGHDQIGRTLRLRKQWPSISNGLFDKAAHGLVCLIGLHEWCIIQSQVGLIRDYLQFKSKKKTIKIKQMNVVLESWALSDGIMHTHKFI